ncbi:kyphoscoliosis peptidase-like isoform X2 [Tiliqua scincoides]|uniref:kyphoscoliosis peptidase-like isoform X2 n=1 Tax=Tiliqua scincoides TaxID=71010 RepID=UPI003462FA00
MPYQGGLSLILDYLLLPSYLPYPWDKSSLKSMPIDLQQLEKLDAYARKVSARSSVESLVSVLLQEAHSDLEKVRAIWMWICHHIEYDGTSASYEPADVLQSGKTVCAGYARLFEKMCSIAGIGCKYLAGYAKGYSFKEGKDVKDKRHAWNAVYIDGRWHLLDCTWASGFVKDGKFTFSYDEFYFLTHPAVFINDHFPEDSKWQLLKPTLSEQEFGRNKRLSMLFFYRSLLLHLQE